MTVNRARKIVWNDLHISLDLEYQTLTQVKAQIDEWIKAYGPDASFREYEPPYSDSTYMHLGVEGPEDDKTYNERISREEKWESEQIERDRKTYEALKAKFEGKDK